MGKSSIAPVEKPVSGVSYNPDYYSHQVRYYNKATFVTVKVSSSY